MKQKIIPTSTSKTRPKTYMKEKIPASLRQMVWITYNDEVFRSKCHVTWCKNTITPFTFEVGHNKPESKGGKTVLENLLPICAQCNRSMGNKYTITEYCEKFTELRRNSLAMSMKYPQEYKTRRTTLFDLFIKPFACFFDKDKV